MNLTEYFQKMELNKLDPDYQIEDYWLGLKNSMNNFYSSVGLVNTKIKLWSSNLNKLKNEKKYDLIEQNIKDHIGIYATDLMKYEKFSDNTHSQILITNINRWNKISNKFHFGNSEKNKKIYLLLDAFYNIKKKSNPDYNYILKLFHNLELMYINNFQLLIVYAFENGLVRVLEFIEQIIGYNQVIAYVLQAFPEISLTNQDKKISFNKLFIRFNKTPTPTPSPK
jgi:hypothetical protein